MLGPSSVFYIHIVYLMQLPIFTFVNLYTIFYFLYLQNFKFVFMVKGVYLHLKNCFNPKTPSVFVLLAWNVLVVAVYTAIMGKKKAASYLVLSRLHTYYFILDFSLVTPKNFGAFGPLSKK